MAERPSLFDLSEGEKRRIAILVEEISRSNEEKIVLKDRIKELDRENSKLCAQVEGMNLLQEEHKLLKNEITYLKVTCKYLEGSNITIQRKCNELQLKLQENITVQDGRLESILQERQTLMLKTQKLKYKVKQLQEINERLFEEVQSYKKSLHGKCDAAVQFPGENQKSDEVGKSAKESIAESLKDNISSNVQHNLRKIKDSNSTVMNEEKILTDLFFGRNSNHFLLRGRKTILNYI